jgi:hypothetical protein
MRPSRVQVCERSFGEQVALCLCDCNMLTATEASRIRDLAYDYALNTGDDLFLMTLYQWMVQKGKSDQLLEVSKAAAHCQCAIIKADLHDDLCVARKRRQGRGLSALPRFDER